MIINRYTPNNNKLKFYNRIKNFYFKYGNSVKLVNIDTIFKFYFINLNLLNDF